MRAKKSYLLEDIFADNLIWYREKQGLTQNELGKLSGVASAYISQMERGVRLNPTLKTVRKLAAGLNIDPLFLLTTGKVTQR